MIAKSKFALALIGIAMILLNPAGVCAGTPSVHAPSHPCCPVPYTQHHGSGTGACVCIDRQPAAPALPALDVGHLTRVEAIAHLSVFGDQTGAVPVRAGFILEARFLAFHQLLV